MAEKTLNPELAKNFRIWEFACKDGTQVPQRYYSNVQLLAKNLQALRDHLGEPVRINSAYRTPSYNRKIGGAPLSQHLLAKAADITVKSKTPKQLAAIVERLIKQGKMQEGGLGIYPGFIHYDVRPQKARW